MSCKQAHLKALEDTKTATLVDAPQCITDKPSMTTSVSPSLPSTKNNGNYKYGRCLLKPHFAVYYLENPISPMKHVKSVEIKICSLYSELGEYAKKLGNTISELSTLLNIRCGLQKSLEMSDASVHLSLQLPPSSLATTTTTTTAQGHMKEEYVIGQIRREDIDACTSDATDMVATRDYRLYLDILDEPIKRLQYNISQLKGKITMIKNDISIREPSECQNCCTVYRKVEMIQTNCFHIFCFPCIYYERLATKGASCCPICQDQITEYYRTTLDPHADNNGAKCVSSIVYGNWKNE